MYVLLSRRCRGTEEASRSSFPRTRLPPAVGRSELHNTRFSFTCDLFKSWYGLTEIVLHYFIRGHLNYMWLLLLHDDLYTQICITSYCTVAVGGHVLTLLVNLVLNILRVSECFVKYLRFHINDPCLLQRLYHHNRHVSESKYFT